MARRLYKAIVGLVVTLAAASELGGHTEDTRHVYVAAKRFCFEPSEITIRKGENVMITVHAKDATHGLVIDALGVATVVRKGRSKDLMVRAEETGTFEGKCAHFCGKGHKTMTLMVYVVE